MTPTDQLASARKLLALVKAEIEKGAEGKWNVTAAERPQVLDSACCTVCLCYGTVPARKANAHNIAASHNAMPTALEDIENDLEFFSWIVRSGTMIESGQCVLNAEEAIARKLALLETLAREFGVEVPQ